MASRPLPIATAASSAETSHNGTAGTPPRLAPSPRSMAAATRRSFLGGAIALPSAMVGTVAACTATPAAAQAVSADLLALVHQAKVSEDAANTHTYGPMNEAEERTDAALEAVPHIEMAVGEGLTGSAIVRSTAQPSSVAVNRTLVTLGREGKFPASTSLDMERRFRAATLRRDRTIKAIRRRSGISGLVAENDALWDTCSNTRDAVALFPVRTPADLAHKLAFMVKHQMGDGSDWLPQLLADARTLAKMEG